MAGPVARRRRREAVLLLAGVMVVGLIGPLFGVLGQNEERVARMWVAAEIRDDGTAPHCGSLPWYSPIRVGWQEFFGNFNGAMDYFSHINSAGRNDLYEGETPTEAVGYYTDLLGDRPTWLGRIPTW